MKKRKDYADPSLLADLFLELLEFHGLGTTPEETMKKISDIILKCSKHVDAREMLELVKLVKTTDEFIAKYPEFFMSGKIEDLRNRIVEHVIRLSRKVSSLSPQ